MWSDGSKTEARARRPASLRASFGTGRYCFGSGSDTSTNGFAETNGYVLGPNGELVTEVDGQGSWLHTNVYAAGELVATYDPQGLHFHLTDWLGTRRIQTDYTGNIIESTFQSLPFGEMVPDNRTANLGATEHQFTGKERDTESGNDYFGARYYASSIGRFSSPDPSGLYYADPSNPQSLNLYSYVQNNLLTNVDPTGLDCVHLNDAGNGVESNDQHSNSGECGQNHGYWVDGTATHVQLYSNNDDVGLSGHTTDSQGNQTSTDSFYTNATGHLSGAIQENGLHRSHGNSGAVSAL